jgi:ATP-dependent DNA ligase
MAASPKPATANGPPKWVRPQLALLVKEAPSGTEWLHEIKFDGYRMHARVDGGDVRLLTRSGLDWTHKYEATRQALSALRATKSAYIDGEPCAVRARESPGSGGE